MEKEIKKLHEEIKEKQNNNQNPGALILILRDYGYIYNHFSQEISKY